MPPARLMRKTWRSDSPAGAWPSGSSILAKLPSTCSTTISSRTIWSAWTSASRWSKRPIPSVLAESGKDRGARSESAWLYDNRRHHARAQSVHRRVLSRSVANEPHDSRDVLPDGRPARTSIDALSGRRRNCADHPAIHRLSGPLDEVCRIHEEGRASAR